MRALETFRRLLSPKNFYVICEQASSFLGFAFIVSLCLGLYGGFTAPMDYQQGQAFRMIYVHVPAAFLSLFIYSCIFLCSVIYLIWQVKIADVIAKLSASLGACFTFLALFSGALWGKPMWGTFWVWDARLTSELILLFIYFGYMGLRAAFPNLRLQSKIAALFAIVGMVDIPLVHFSVNWWQTLHQGATLAKFARPSMPSEMLWPLISMIVACLMFYIWMLSVRVRGEILKREKHTQWVFTTICNPNKEFA